MDLGEGLPISCGDLSAIIALDNKCDNSAYTEPILLILELLDGSYSRLPICSVYIYAWIILRENTFQNNNNYSAKSSTTLIDSFYLMR